MVWTGGRGLPGGVGVEQFNDEGLTIGVDYRVGESEKEKVEEEDRLNEVVRLLEAGAGSCKVSKEIQTERWIKVIW